MLVMSYHHNAVQLANCSILQDHGKKSFRLRSMSPSVEQLVDVIGLSADKNDWPWGVDDVIEQYVARYGSSRLCKHLNSRTADVNVIHCLTGSQCNSRNVDGQLCQKCLHQKLLKSINPFSSYNRQCRKCF